MGRPAGEHVADEGCEQLADCPFKLDGRCKSCCPGRPHAHGAPGASWPPDHLVPQTSQPVSGAQSKRVACALNSPFGRRGYIFQLSRRLRLGRPDGAAMFARLTDRGAQFFSALVNNFCAAAVAAATTKKIQIGSGRGWPAERFHWPKLSTSAEGSERHTQASRQAEPSKQAGARGGIFALSSSIAIGARLHSLALAHETIVMSWPQLAEWTGVGAKWECNRQSAGCGVCGLRRVACRWARASTVRPPNGHDDIWQPDGSIASRALVCCCDLVHESAAKLGPISRAGRLSAIH